MPKAEIDKARARLREADRAQKRRDRARSQLLVRVNAPTGTATFDMLVKLVAGGPPKHRPISPLPASNSLVSEWKTHISARTPFLQVLDRNSL